MVGRLARGRQLLNALRPLARLADRSRSLDLVLGGHVSRASEGRPETDHVGLAKALRNEGLDP
jgi:hypothetical protein